MAKRYFVTVLAPSRQTLIKLGEYDLDLFQPTATVTERQEFAIEGLLTLEEVGRLVDDGYRVLVSEEASKRARARTETAEFREWLKGMGE